jgi:hypothetical protein
MEKAVKNAVPVTIIGVIIAGLFLIITMFNNPVIAKSPQKNGGGKPIPEGIMKIADKSCVRCHTEPGDPMAITHLNLSNWDKFSPEKQAEKANAMCSMITRDKMPPHSFRKNHPDGVPTKEELKTICDWAQSLVITKK